MSLRRRLPLALGLLTLGLGVAAPLAAQAPTPPPPLLQPVKDLLSRTGARRTFVVAAVDRVKGAVVNIHSERTVAQHASDTFPLPPAQSRVNGMGTGIIIDPRGYIVTNHHVIDDVNSLRVRLADGSTANAVVVARNPEVDLALIKIDPPTALPVMPVGTASDLMVGETVIALGNAYGYEHTVSVGVVSAVKRDVSLNKDMAYKSLIQTDAAINPGNSGGPLVNVNGELVGVNVAIRAGAQGIGFAIPVDHMVRTVTDLLRSRRRAYTYDGLYCKDVLEPTTDGLHRRVFVDRVDPNSPAFTSGLKPGDEVVQMGGVKVVCGIDVERAFLERRAGEVIAVVARRGDQEKRFDLTLASPDRVVTPVAGVDVVWQRLGVQLAPVAADLVGRVNSELRGGLEVTAVASNSAAARAGIRKGDILVGLHQYETVSLDNVTYVLNLPDVSPSTTLPFYVLRSGQVRKGQIVP